MSDFDIDLVMGPRRAARTAWIVAGCSCAVTMLLALIMVVSRKWWKFSGGVLRAG